MAARLSSLALRASISLPERVRFLSSLCLRFSGNQQNPDRENDRGKYLVNRTKTPGLSSHRSSCHAELECVLVGCG